MLVTHKKVIHDTNLIKIVHGEPKIVLLKKELVDRQSDYFEEAMLCHFTLPKFTRNDHMSEGESVRFSALFALRDRRFRGRKSSILEVTETAIF